MTAPRASRSPRASRPSSARSPTAPRPRRAAARSPGQGTSLALNGVITTNRILSKANAYVDGQRRHATARRLHGRREQPLADRRDTESASSSGANAMGFQLAFNTIGWQPTNLLFAALDALIGDPTIQTAAFGGQEPARDARLRQATRDVDADGADHAVGALGADRLRARRQLRHVGAGRAVRRRRHERQRRAREQHGQRASCARSSSTATLSAGEHASPDRAGARSTPGDRVELRTATSTSTSASPRGPPVDLTDCDAALRDEPADWRKVDAVSITASDEAEISSSTSMYGEVSPTNDAGAGILNNWAGSRPRRLPVHEQLRDEDLVFGDRVRLADDYYDAWSRTRSGSSTARAMIVSLTTGDFVRLTDDYDGGTGHRRLHLPLPRRDRERRPRGRELRRSLALGRGRRRLPVDGHDGPTSRDLGAEDYTDFEHWKELTPTTLITDSLSYALLSEVGRRAQEGRPDRRLRQLLRPDRPQRRPDDGRGVHPGHDVDAPAATSPSSPPTRR